MPTAYFWERDDADAVAARYGVTARRGRFQGEDDDEDQPWLVDLPEAAAGLDDLLAEYDGWLEPDTPPAGQAPTGPDGGTAPVPLPDGPRRFK